MSTGLAGQPNIFSLDARQAGYGDFDVVIKGVSRASIEYLEEDEALYKIKYYVSLPGDYQIEIKYDLHHIPGNNSFPVSCMAVFFFFAKIDTIDLMLYRKAIVFQKVVSPS